MVILGGMLGLIDGENLGLIDGDRLGVKLGLNEGDKLGRMLGLNEGDKLLLMDLEGDNCLLGAKLKEGVILFEGDKEKLNDGVTKEPLTKDLVGCSLLGEIVVNFVRGTGRISLGLTCENSLAKLFTRDLMVVVGS